MDTSRGRAGGGVADASRKKEEEKRKEICASGGGGGGGSLAHTMQCIMYGFGVLTPRRITAA